MIKLLLLFWVCSVAVAAGFFSTSAHAASSTVVITHIQAGGVGAATQEFIVLYNNSVQDVDISDWCLTNKNNLSIACIQAASGRAVSLPSYGYAVVVSAAYASVFPTLKPTAVYTPISQSSGSITGSAGTITLLDKDGLVVDRQSWTTSLSAGMHYARSGTGTPTVYVDTDTTSDWSVKLATALPDDQTTSVVTALDLCPNIDGDQPEILDGKVFDAQGVCVDRIILPLLITEILPNAAGADEMKEFIELYNPNNVPLYLDNYWLFVGPQNDNRYAFPAGIVVAPKEYRTFSHADIPYTLLNSSSRVTVTLDDGTVIFEAPAYSDPADDESWAFINDTWVYTNNPTPGAANSASSERVSDAVAVQVYLKPCAANQYRSEETNRCRHIPTVATQTPCKDNQYRSEETNRCRNIVSDTKTPAPCAPGEERNAETNRCRKITKMDKAAYGVLGAQTKNDGSWYVIAAVACLMLLALGYAIWEWHREIRTLTQRMVARLRRQK